MAAKPPTARSFRPDIEGLRAIAVLGVLAFHSGVPHVGGGYVGVDVFYVISGFLITGLMLRDSKTETPLGSFLGTFYARRARRILPAATLVLITTLLGASLLQNALENAALASDARWTALFGSNFRFAGQAADYFAANNPPSPFLQYWSLSLEEQFYLVWPLLFWGAIALTKRSGLVGLRRTLIAVALSSFALSIWWMRTSPINAFYLLPPRAWELSLGALLATYTNELSSLPPHIRRRGVLVGLAIIVATMVAFTEQTAFPGWAALPPTLGTAIVIACGDVGSGVGLAFLSSRPMQLIGRFSFSLYLWHWPALVLKIEHVKWVYASWTTRTAFMLLASLPASIVTYYLIENPLRNARALRTSWRRSLLFGAALIGLALAGTFAFERLGSNARLSTDRTVAATAGHLSGAVVPTNFVPTNLVPSLVDTRDHHYTYCGSPCTVGLPGAHHKVLLFGNSHAAHWGTAFQAAAPLLDADVEIHSPGGCTSFLIPVELLAHTDKRACEARRASVFAHLDAEPPDVLVLSNLSIDAFEASPKQWEDGVRAAIRRAPKTTKVVVFAETPRMKQSMPLCLVANLEHTERCDQQWPAELNARLQRIVTEEGATFIDLRPLFCTTDRCPAITEDTLIYADGDHLTIAFSSARASWLADTLRPLLGGR